MIACLGQSQGNIDVWNYRTVNVRYAGSGVDQPLLSYICLLRATLQIMRRRANKKEDRPFFREVGARAPRAPVWIRLC